MFNFAVSALWFVLIQANSSTEKDKRNCLLISRVASLGKLRHKPIGFTGPLSRNHLAYHSMISAVRNSLRDLIEMTIASLLLHGDAEREGRSDWLDLGLEYVGLVYRLLSLTYPAKPSIPRR